MECSRSLWGVLPGGQRNNRKDFDKPSSSGNCVELTWETERLCPAKRPLLCSNVVEAWPTQTARLGPGSGTGPRPPAFLQELSFWASCTRGILCASLFPVIITQSGSKSGFHLGLRF